MIQVYTGNGKGKTTCALGLICRALGRGRKVALIQFMKKWEYGEILFFSKQKNIDIYQYGTPDFVDPENPSRIDYEEAAKAYEKTLSCLTSGDYDLVIADEINVAVKWNLLTLENQLKLFDFKDTTEIVMTGRYAMPQIIDKADLVTEMKEIKHYFNDGYTARKGIEY